MATSKPPRQSPAAAQPPAAQPAEAPSTTPAPPSSPESRAVALVSREEFGEVLGLVQSALALTEARYKGLADLEAQRAQAAEDRATALEATVQKVEAMVSLLQDFLAQIDEQTEKMVDVTAALIKFQQQLAAQVAQSQQTMLR